MLARITGMLESIEGQTALIASPDHSSLECAYEVLMPTIVADELAPRIGSPVTLHTFQYVEQQAQGANLTPRLVGFATTEQRRFFKLFTTVKGVGTRKALRALAAPFDRIAAAIANRDAKFLQTLPEIGKRTAETIVAELHGKVDDFVTAGPDPSGGLTEPKPAGALSDTARQTVDALVRLGETRESAERLVHTALPDPAEGQTISPDELLAAVFALRS